MTCRKRKRQPQARLIGCTRLCSSERQFYEYHYSLRESAQLVQTIKQAEQAIKWLNRFIEWKRD